MHRPKYFTPNEVSLHNTIGDIWVSFLGKVYDLTPLVNEYKDFWKMKRQLYNNALKYHHRDSESVKPAVCDVLLKPIIECAGKDISHWFNPKTKDIRTHVDPLSGCLKYYTPKGRFVHVPPPCPCTDWANDFGTPWWRDNCYEVGMLSAKTQWIRIINTLTSQEQCLEVCSEETLNEILQRYLYYNSHATGYTWKHNRVSLDMSKTLSENGIPDEDEDLYSSRIDRDLFTQSICLYFNDDLTEI